MTEHKVIHLPCRSGTAKLFRPKQRRNRQINAMAIRDAVQSAIRSKKVFSEQAGHCGPGRFYHGGDFNLLYLEPTEVGRYGLEIWPVGSNIVMNIWWGAVTGFDIASFRRGDWERRLLAHIAYGMGVALQDVDPRMEVGMVIPFG